MIFKFARKRRRNKHVFLVSPFSNSSKNHFFVLKKKERKHPLFYRRNKKVAPFFLFANFQSENVEQGERDRNITRSTIRSFLQSSLFVDQMTHAITRSSSLFSPLVRQRWRIPAPRSTKMKTKKPTRRNPQTESQGGNKRDGRGRRKHKNIARWKQTREKKDKRAETRREKERNSVSQSMTLGSGNYYSMFCVCWF